MKIGKLTYNGIASDSLGVFVTGSGSYNAAAWDYVSYQIPGKSGDLQIPNNRYKNIDVTYPAFIPGDFETRVQAVRNWMRSSDGYARIEDNYDPDHYRMGVGKDVLSFSPVKANEAANFQLVFDCKPQRWLKSGEEQKTISSGGKLTNPTQYEAKPIITFTNPTSGGYIRVTKTGKTYELSCVAAYTGAVTVDCETMNIYSGTTNLNNKFSGEFPKLLPGQSTITFSGLSSVKIIPRWWEL